MPQPKGSSFRIRKTVKPPYTVDNDKLDQFDLKQLIFNRVHWDPSWGGFQRFIDEGILDIIREKKPGYSHVDFALRYAAWTLYDSFPGSFARSRIPKVREPAAEKHYELPLPQYEVKDPTLMSTQIKRVAKLIGASLVGVCPLNRMWLYADADVPLHFKSAIVLAVEMDPAGIATSPTMIAAGATGVGYSRMGFVLALLGEFIRNLGYEAIQCGNDTGLSVPLAIDAGLGQLGRNGLLVTPQFGSRVRLCKVFTNLPLQPDSPIEFGVTETCTKCKRCAEACEVDAISKEDHPTFDGVCTSNNPGALKWFIDADRCYQFWCDNGGDCSTCITVCPYNFTSTIPRTIHPDQFWQDG